MRFFKWRLSLINDDVTLLEKDNFETGQLRVGIDLKSFYYYFKINFRRLQKKNLAHYRCKTYYSIKY